MGRRLLIILHDLVATAAAILLSFYLRFEGAGLIARADWFVLFVPVFVLYAALIYRFFGLYRSKWRFASLPDLFNIVRASSVLAISLLVLDYILIAPYFYGAFFFGKITIALYWLLQIFLLGAARFAYRYFRLVRTRKRLLGLDSAPVLLIGRAADADMLLRGIESGAVNGISPVGILSPSIADSSQAIRGVPVLGKTSDLERVTTELGTQSIRVTRIIMLPSAFEPEAAADAVMITARRLGIICSQLPSPYNNKESLRLTPIAVEDLLLRPTVEIDSQRLQNFVEKKSIVITGGGGSIGSEICDRVVALGAAKLLILESSELALHSIMERLSAGARSTRIEGRIADIRDRERVLKLITGFRPDLVFHAAALKHLPLLEEDWDEGVKTNIFGTVNVADAAVEAGAAALIMVSTDKAIEPVSVLGKTKRFAEMYCQALDAKLTNAVNRGHGRTRLVSVRFGNVLASTGSVVPKFKAQIEAGGPVTVTHPEMVRYFMTNREACDLVITAGSHAVGNTQDKVSVYELNMGQPVKILDIAERMIRLAGLEPGRDIQIVYSGIRPGERLHEFLSAHEGPGFDIGIDGVLASVATTPALEDLRQRLEALKRDLSRKDKSSILRMLDQFAPSADAVSA